MPPPTTSATGTRIGRSTDEGTTWQWVMAYADVTAINPCLAAFCQSICDNEVSMSLWTAEVCSAAPPATTGPAAGQGALMLAPRG